MDFNENQFKILIVDDEAAIRQSFTDYLEDQGYEILTAENGSVGLQIIQNETPDLVLTDLRMPEMGGLELLQQSCKVLPESPFIIISGAGRLDDAIEAVRLGAWDYLQKPVKELEVLGHLVKNMLEKASLIRENKNYKEHLEDLVTTRTEQLNERNRDLEEARQKLQKAHDELEQRVNDRTSELQEANIKLKQSHEKLIRSERLVALGNMVAGVAHEINTPVGICVSESTYLEDITKEVVEYFKDNHLTKSHFDQYLKNASETSASIYRNLKRVAELIQSFKQVAVDQTANDHRTFFLKDYLDDILLSLHSKLKKTNYDIRISCPDNLKIISFPGAFAQIITNLLINSLQHGFSNRDQGSIEIDIKNDGKRITLCYKDDGHGMDEKVLNQVFDPFFTTNRSQGGTGLGMHIVYNIVTQRLDGEIRCNSGLDKGVEFIINWPLDHIAKSL